MTNFSRLTLQDVDWYKGGGAEPKAKSEILSVVKWFQLNPYVRNRRHAQTEENLQSSVVNSTDK